MFTPEEAAAMMKVSQRTIYRWVEAGRIHFRETENGNLLVCLIPLSVGAA
jgi:excisionase family DNA binding protein